VFVYRRGEGGGGVILTGHLTAEGWGGGLGGVWGEGEEWGGGGVGEGGVGGGGGLGKAYPTSYLKNKTSGGTDKVNCLGGGAQPLLESLGKGVNNRSPRLARKLREKPINGPKVGGN